MPKNAPPPPSSDPAGGQAALIWGCAVIAAITAYRLVLLRFSTADLFVDELQYWQWGQALDWGYFSKPPLIGWVLRAVTDLAGSSEPFWIRMVGSLFHAATALILMLGARRFTSAPAAALVGVIYVSMPLIAVGSFLISTDTTLLPFFALAVVLYMRLVEKPSVAVAICMGAAIGLGMMAKYAAIYFWMGAALGALFVPAYRIRRLDLYVAVAAFAAVISPNVIWNLQNDLTTLAHTADNVDWVNRSGIALHPDKAAEFFGAQFAVMGPVFFAALLWWAPKAMISANPGPRLRWLAWMCLPIILLVTVQALLSRAYANWAATAYVAAVLLVVPVLWVRARRWLWIGLAFNLAITAAVPVAVTQATSWRLGAEDRLVLRRYVGRKALADRVLDSTAKAGQTVIVAENRDLLAELFHAARDMDVAIWSEPPRGRPQHYYAQTYPYPWGLDDPFVFVRVGDRGLPCEPLSKQPIDQWVTGDDGFKSAPITMVLMPPDCFEQGQSNR